MLNRKTTYIYKGREFEICTMVVTNEELGLKNKKYWVGVDHKYITNGVLNTRLNVAQMNGGDTIEQCMKRINYNVDLDELMSRGYDYAEAFIELNPWVFESGKTKKQILKTLRKSFNC